MRRGARGRPRCWRGWARAPRRARCCAALGVATTVGAVGLQLGGRIIVGRRAGRRGVLAGGDQLEVRGLQVVLLRHRVGLGDLAELGVGEAVAVGVLEDHVVAQGLGLADLLDHPVVHGDDRSALLRVDVDPAAGGGGLVEAGGVAFLGALGRLGLGEVVGVAGLGGDREVGALGETGDRADQVVGELAVLLGVEQDLVDVPVGVVVGEDPAAQISVAAGGAQVAGGAADRVDRVVGVLAAVAVGVDSVGLPGRGQELHPADRAGGRGHAGELAEVGLDAVDRGKHLPGDPVLGSAGLVDRKQEGRDRELVDDLVGDPDRGRGEVGDGKRRVVIARAAVGVPQRRLLELVAAAGLGGVVVPLALVGLDAAGAVVAVALAATPVAADVRAVEIRTLRVRLRVSVRGGGRAAGGRGARLPAAAVLGCVVLVGVERALAAGVLDVRDAVGVVVLRVRARGEGAAHGAAEVLAVRKVDRNVALARLQEVSALRSGHGGDDHET